MSALVVSTTRVDVPVDVPVDMGAVMDQVAAWESHDHDVSTGVDTRRPWVSHNVR